MKNVTTILIQATIFCVIWIVAAMLSNSIIGVTPPSDQNPGYSLLALWISSLLEVAILYPFVLQIRLARMLRALVVFATVFFLQFLLTQVESWFYLDQTVIPQAMILATVLTGFLVSLVYGLYSIKFPLNLQPAAGISTGKTLGMALILGIVIYPLIYFIAGYFIAWQFEVVRVYYTGSSELTSFPQLMLSNIQNGIFTFQVFRGVCWAVFGFTLLYCSTMNSLMRQGFLMGLLFAMVMTAQLLIPNPYMPPDIRAIHALEVGCSNFIWGFTVAYFWKLSLKQPEGR